MTLTEKSGRLAWCALVALALARQNGDVLSPAQENLFLTRWLATALKQRRFSRDVAPDIEWLLKQGRQLGVGAKLVSKLNYLWRSCTGELPEQNDLFRLTYACPGNRKRHALVLPPAERSGMVRPVCRCTKRRSKRSLSLPV